MKSSTASQSNKEIILVFCLVCATLLIGGSAFAEDDGPQPSVSCMEQLSIINLATNQYITDTDNENNAHTGTPDGDMDILVDKKNRIHPIEFNIIIPDVDPSNRSATLRMDVLDVDTGDPIYKEVDKVYVNGTFLGILNGSSDKWGVNIFDIPIGVLKTGKNLVEIFVDQGIPPGGWYVEVGWGMIELASISKVQIPRAWFTPISVKRGEYINAFAEISDPSKQVAKVEVLSNTTFLFNLTDPDGDFTWSGQYKIPTGWTTGWKGTLNIVAKNAKGTVVAKWSGIEVK